MSPRRAPKWRQLAPPLAQTSRFWAFLARSGLPGRVGVRTRSAIDTDGASLGASALVRTPAKRRWPTTGPLSSLREVQSRAQPGRECGSVDSSRGQPGHLRDNVIDRRRLEPGEAIHVEKCAQGHPCGAFVPVHPGVAGHQALREHGCLVDQIGLAVVSVPAWSIEGGKQPIAVQHVMARGRLGNLQGCRMAAHQVRRRQVVNRLRRLGARHGRRQRVPSIWAGPRAQPAGSWRRRASGPALR
jgi:hypothetical protein